MIERIIHDRLWENADLVSLTNDPTLPYHVYSCGPVETQKTHSGVVPLERYDVTVTSYHHEWQDAVQLLEEVKAYLHGYHGGQVPFSKLV